MKISVACLFMVLVFAASSFANSILVEENTFPPKYHFGYYGLLQASIYGTTYGPGYTEKPASGISFQYNQEFYFGWEKDTVVRLGLPVYFGIPTDADPEASSSGLFDLGIKVQRLLHHETDSTPSASVLIMGRAPSQDYRSGFGYGYGRAGIMGVLEKTMGAVETRFNAGYVYTFPYQEKNGPVPKNIDPGDRIQLNLGIETPFTHRVNLNYEIISEFIFCDMVEGVVQPGSDAVVVTNLVALNYELRESSYLFAGVQFPLYIRQCRGTSAIIPMAGLYYEF